MFDQLGNVLEALCCTGREEAVLVAPFIKRPVLARLLSALPAPVRLLCVTRWRPEEVAAGVSDPDVWLDLKGREGATLCLCSSLHAKYYRVDETCYIGSANLTATALGWTAAPNLEILFPYRENPAGWKAFEQRLEASSVLCSEAIYQEMKATADLLKSEFDKGALLFTERILNFDLLQFQESDPPASNGTHSGLTGWLPQSREPADLYLVYSGQVDLLTDEARTKAASDLTNLRVPTGLTEALFRRFVALQLLQVPCIAAVDSFVSQPKRFGAVKAYLISLPCSKSPWFDATRAWQTLMRWLLYFFPGRYEHYVPNHSEIFRKIQ